MVKGMSNEVMVEVGRCIVYWLVKFWQRRKGLMYSLPTDTATIGSTTFFPSFFLLVLIMHITLFIVPFIIL